MGQVWLWFKASLKQILQKTCPHRVETSRRPLSTISKYESMQTGQLICTPDDLVPLLPEADAGEVVVVPVAVGSSSSLLTT